MPNAGIPTKMTTLPQLLSSAGYHCHISGKYDVGMATNVHTPEGRGFNSSLIYFSHAVDHFTQNSYGMGDNCCVCNNTFVDLWDTGKPARALNGTAYADELFLERALDIIKKHDFSAPLYLHYTPHATHDPLQIPLAWLKRFPASPYDESFCNISIQARLKICVMLVYICLQFKYTYLKTLICDLKVQLATFIQDNL